MTKPTTIKIPFHDGEILAIIENDEVYVPIKPICEDIGLRWNGQLRLIKNNKILSSTMHVTCIVAKDNKSREMLCLPLTVLDGWLFKIPVERYSGDKKEKILKYQYECFRVLYEYFHEGGSINPQAASSQILALKAKIEFLDQFAPEGKCGEISEINGRPRTIKRRACYQAPPRKSCDKNNPNQLPLPGFSNEEQS